MPKFERLIYQLWELILVFIASLILLIFFLFPSAPEWIVKILWIIFGYLLSNVLNFVMSELKPSKPKVESVSELSLLRQDISEFKKSLKNSNPS